VTATTEGLRDGARAERALTEPRGFGDGEAIAAQVADLYECQLEILSWRFPCAARVTGELQSRDSGERREIIRHPVVRLTLNRAIARAKERGTLDDMVEAAFEVIAQRMNEFAEVPASLRERTTSHSTFPAPLDAQVAEIFQDIIGQAGDVPTVLREPDDDVLDLVDAAGKLMEQHLPLLAPAVFRAARWVGFVDVSSWKTATEGDRATLYESGSVDAFAGAIFVTARAARDPWAMGESLFHEACHQRYYDVAATRALYKDRRDGTATIKTPWNRAGSNHPNIWSLDKALLALHVYVHLVTLFVSASESHENQARAGADEGLEAGLCRASARAHYLADAISGHPGLARDGSEFVEWLRTVLEEIAPAATVSRVMPR